MNKIKSLYRHYNNLAVPIKASIWFVICSLIQKGLAFITVPIFTRLLTPEQYGLFSVYQSWYGIIAVFTTLNLYAGVFNNGMLKYENDRDGFQSSLISLSLMLTTIFSIIYLINMNFWNNLFEMSTPLIIAMLLDSFFSVSISFWSARQRFDYKYRALIALTLTSAIVAPLLGVIGVLLTTTYKAEARIFTFVFVHIVIGGTLCIMTILKGKKLYVREYWKFALAFNIPLIPHYLSQTILNQADRIMISQMVGTDKAAIYSVAYSTAMLMTIFSQSINNSFIPWTYKSLRDKNYNEIRRISKLLLILIGGISLLVILFAPEVIFILAGSTYSEAVIVIPPVAGSVFFMFLYPLFGNIEFYFEETKFIMVASSIAAIINVLLNLTFIPRFGYVAAGYTTLICYIVISLAHYIFMKKLCVKNGIPMTIYDVKFIIIFSIIYIGVIVGITLIYPYLLIRYILIATIFIVTIWKRNIIINALKTLKNKK